jgi:hypothetical protein
MIMTKSMGRDYSGRKTTESLGNVKKGKKMERARGSAMTTVGPSMYSITENIYYSQLSSVAILLQPETHCFTSYNTRKGLCSLSCAIVLRSPLPPTCLLLTANEAHSYFASTIRLWTAATKESIVYSPGHIWACRTMVEWCRQKTTDSSTGALAILPIQSSGSKQEEMAKGMRI